MEKKINKFFTTVKKVTQTAEFVKNLEKEQEENQAVKKVRAMLFSKRFFESDKKVKKLSVKSIEKYIDKTKEFYFYTEGKKSFIGCVLTDRITQKKVRLDLVIY